MAWFPLLALLGLLLLLLLLRQRTRKENRRLDVEVAQRTAQLTELTRHLLTAREDERHRLARDLHDELGALLTSCKLDAARMRSRLVASAPGAPEALERLQHLVGTLDSVIALKRRIIEDLHPSALSHLGLVLTLQILLREFGDSAGLQVHTALAEVPLAADAQLVVYRLVQEAVNNIAKHAKAKQLWVDLDLHEDQVRVRVRDDGTGFETAAPLRSAFGLVGMRFRIEAAQGSLHVRSAPGEGTCIEALLPVS
jgi:signal transduction histidine kinase